MHAYIHTATPKLLRTPLWVLECTRRNTTELPNKLLYKYGLLFQPVPDTPISSADQMSIAITGYDDEFRDVLQRLVALTGARFTKVSACMYVCVCMWVCMFVCACMILRWC